MENAHPKKTILVVSLVNALANVVLAICKIFIGKIANSQALIADGVHSLSDLVSDGLVFVAANTGMKDPDKEHPYGHRRVETLATLLLACLLASVAFSIGYEAMQRLLRHAFFQPDWPAMLVAGLSVLANEALFFYSFKKGKAINSTLLISNAWHKRSDSFVSLIVLLSIIGGYFGLRWLDPIGALLITLLILYIAVKMVWQAVQELIDRAVDEKTLASIRQIIEAVPGVSALHQLRTRLHGDNVFVDVHVLVDPYISVSEGHHIGEMAHVCLHQKMKKISDVVIHIDPEDDENAQPSLSLPDRSNLENHLQVCWGMLPGYDKRIKITLHYFNGKINIDLLLPMDALSNTNPEDLQKRYQNAVDSMGIIRTVTLLYTVTSV